MANPTVDKLKTLALRFADKVAVAITAVLCLVFVFLAVSKETIDTTPDRVSEIANQAQQNINRQQEESAIVSKIEEDGMVLQDFGTQVAARESTKVDVRQFALARAFVKAEPGAGLIRDSVNDELLAPYELIATSGRGGMPFAVRDASGNLVPPDPDDKKSSMSGMAAMYGMGESMMPGMGGGGLGGTSKKNVRQEQLADRQETVRTKKSQAAIAGAAGLPLPEEAEDTLASTAPADFKTEVRGQRWVAVVGLLNNKQFRERYAKALKVPVESPESHPDYKRIELSRQSYDPVAGDWSSWTTVDPNTLNDMVADVAFEEDPTVELTPDPVRLDPIVAFLPYLSAGYWAGVHHAQLIPPDKLRELLAEKEEQEENLPMGGMMGMMGMMGGGRGGMSESAMMESMMGSGMGGMMGGRSDMAMMGGMGMMGMGMGMGMGRPASAGPEHMTEEDIIMVRGLDYTVEPGTTYRYRVRIVVANPNYNREDVAPGVDTAAREISGPWSDPTEVVRVPADVSIFALNPARGGYSEDTVVFDVAAWDRNTGSLVVSTFPTAPGEFVGRTAQREVAVEGEDRPVNKVINLQSRQLVLDTMGGQKPVQNLGLPSTFELPAVVAVLRPDGTIALHNQSNDATDEQLLFMRESYRLSISNELNKKNRGNDIGMMYGGMMGSF